MRKLAELPRFREEGRAYPATHGHGLHFRPARRQARLVSESAHENVPADSASPRDQGIPRPLGHQEVKRPGLICGTRGLQDFGLRVFKLTLSDMDSNHDKGLQRALCYRYTIGHCLVKVAILHPTANKNSPANHRLYPHGTAVVPKLLPKFASGIFPSALPLLTGICTTQKWRTRSQT